MEKNSLETIRDIINQLLKHDVCPPKRFDVTITVDDYNASVVVAYKERCDDRKYGLIKYH